MNSDRKRDFLREHLREVPPFRALLRSVECEILQREARLPGESRILDFGAGDGHFATLVFDNPPLVGMDPERETLREAVKRKSHLHFVAAQGEKMPWPDGFFSCVVANSVLEHIPEIDATLKEINRILKREGRLVMTAPSERFGETLLGSSLLRGLKLTRLAETYASWFNRHSLHFHTDSPVVWRERLKNYDFRTTLCEYYFPPRSQRIFDFTHYVNTPCLLNRKLTGRWILFPNSWLRRTWYRILKPFCDSSFQPEGACLFITARKIGNTGDPIR